MPNADVDRLIVYRSCPVSREQFVAFWAERHSDRHRIPSNHRSIASSQSDGEPALQSLFWYTEGMSNLDDLQSRFDRVKRAVDAVIEHDRQAVRAKPFVTANGKRAGILVDFWGDRSPDEVEDNIDWIVYNVWHLADHIRRTLKQIGKNPKLVDDTIENCRALKICADLAERDKHGPERKGGHWTGESLRYGHTQPSLKLTDGVVTMESNPNGSISPTVSKDNPVVYSREIVNAAGDAVGDAVEIADDAMTCWESLLTREGIQA